MNKLARFGWDTTWQTAFDAAKRPKARPGRVVRTHRRGLDVVTTVGRESCSHNVPRRDRLAAPGTGDWVVVEDIPEVERPEITVVLPRRTAVVRRDPADKAAPQLLAANADVVGIVISADRPVNPRRIERFTALACGSDADVVVIVTKLDVDPSVLKQASQLVPNIPVLGTSVITNEGLDRIDSLTNPAQTIVLLGESGAGKSSLINAVVGKESQTTGAVRSGDSKGRHTTTRRELIGLKTGGAMLDTPGIRAVGLWPSHVGLDEAFPEIAEAAETCRFRDCTHRNEPGCGINEAVQNEEVQRDRYDSFQQLVTELDHTERELDQRHWK